MEDDETTESVAPIVDEGDSAPFRDALRRAEAAEAKLEEIETAKRDAETVVQQLRSDAMDVIVKSLDIPNLRDDLLRWVEGDVTLESVNDALQAKGLNFVQPAPQPAPEELQPEVAPITVSPVPVSKLGQSVADAASGAVEANLDTALLEADDRATVIKLMDEADASVSYI